MRKAKVQMASAALGLLVTIAMPAVGTAAAINGADGTAGSDAIGGGYGGPGGDGAGNTGSGGAGDASGVAGLDGSNGTGGGGGGGAIISNGGAGGSSDFGIGGSSGTIVTYAKGGGEEAGGGGGFGGSSGVDSGAGGGGGGGRGATVSDDVGTIDAADPVTGGNGGAGGAGQGVYGDGGGGGGGGIGVVFTGADHLSINGTILGGAGGSGGDGGWGYASLGTYAGGGGNGGSGLRATQSTSTVIVNATITGGNGGMSGVSQFNPAITVGGVGGSGLISAAEVENNNTISGGNGGAGADAIDQTGPISNGSGGGIGGAGGNGLVLTGTNSSSNSTMGVISGGNGGDGGNGGAGGGVATVGGKGGKGGAGGIGLLTSSGATFTNEGTITGGSGGAASIGGAGSTTQSPPVLADGGLAGVGGVGVSGSDLTLINDGSITGGLDGDGVIRANAITFTGGANTLELWAGSTILGNVVGTGSDTLALGGASDGSFDISAVDAGEQYQGFSALQKNGTSDWTVTGTQTTTAAWLVNAGTLSVNGDISSASSVAVNSGGTLGGTGTIGTTTIDSGGALAPGNSIGTLTVVGDLTFNSGANYNVEVSPSTADRTNATGTAALAGAVNATYAAGSYTVRQYTILNAASGITGTFDALNNVSLPSTLAATLSYDNNNVYLDLRLHFPAPGGTLSVNQQNVADTLNNYFYTNGGIQTPFTLLDANGLSQASGETGGSLEQSVLTGAGSFMGSVFDNAFGAFGASGNTTGQGGQALGLAEPVRIASTSDDAFGFSAPHEQMQRWSAWAIGYGGYARVSGDSGAGTHDTTSRVYGVSAGATFHASPDLSLGIALGGASSDFGVAQGFGSGEADAFNVALYGRQAIGAGYVAAALGYTAQDATTDRTVSAGGATDVLHASFHPQALTTRLETGWRFTTGSFGITPYAAIQTATLFLPSYGETATSGPGIFALSYDRHSFTATRGEIGPRFDKTILLGDQALTLKAKTAWAHDWNNDPVTTATFQQLPGTSFTVSGAKPAVDSALLSLDADLALGRGWSVNIGFDGEFSHTTESYVGRGNLRYEW